MGGDFIEAEIRGRIRGMIQAIVEEELEAVLGAGISQRLETARSGYRHGSRERQLTPVRDRPHHDAAGSNKG